MHEIISPDIEWLQRRWSLPEHAAPHVQRLMAAHDDGNTACELAAPIPVAAQHWGNAATLVPLDGAEPSPKPLVIVESAEGAFLQSWHFFQAERQIASRLLHLAKAQTGLPADAKRLGDLFPGAPPDDRQFKATQVALARRLTLITGGPGTGKTYALTRILTLLLESGMNASEIRLAAPTGKAADRMKAAVRDSLSHSPTLFGDTSDALKRVADSSATLHSTIGYNPGTGRCHFCAANPLPIQALIVDECSMVDVLLWRGLLAALPQNIRLILLGDPNQLESVGHGNVFGELARIAALAGSQLSASHVHLTEARRFKERPGILSFARAIEAYDSDAAVDLLQQSGEPGNDSGLLWIKTSGGAWQYEAFPQQIRTALEQVAGADSPQAALTALDKVCILTAQRESFVGSKATSALIELHFSRHPTLHRNRPIIINQNDPETGLRNGSVGVIHTDAEGVSKAWFPALKGELQGFSTAKLPEYSPAWAITIHRSQGSEFDDVLVVLPQKESPMATRELLYTAITRAKRNVIIAGDIETVRTAAAKRSTRKTLLAFHLLRATPAAD